MVAGDSVQEALPVMSTCAPFAVALAVKSAGNPDVMETVPELGLTVMAVTPLRKTVAVAVALSPSALAVIMAVPKDTPDNTPLAGSTVATRGESLDQLTPLLTWLRLPSSNVPKTCSAGFN